MKKLIIAALASLAIVPTANAAPKILNFFPNDIGQTVHMNGKYCLAKSDLGHRITTTFVIKIKQGDILYKSRRTAIRNKPCWQVWADVPDFFSTKLNPFVAVFSVWDRDTNAVDTVTKPLYIYD